MNIYSKSGSKERLFEMMQGVNGIKFNDKIKLNEELEYEEYSGRGDKIKRDHHFRLQRC